MNGFPTHNHSRSGYVHICFNRLRSQISKVLSRLDLSLNLSSFKPPKGFNVQINVSLT